MLGRWEELWSHSKREGQEKKVANHKCFWAAGEREKPQAREQRRAAQQGGSGECKSNREKWKNERKPFPNQGEAKDTPTRDIFTAAEER